MLKKMIFYKIITTNFKSPSVKILQVKVSLAYFLPVFLQKVGDIELESPVLIGVYKKSLLSPKSERTIKISLEMITDKKARFKSVLTDDFSFISFVILSPESLAKINKHQNPLQRLLFKKTKPEVIRHDLARLSYIWQELKSIGEYGFLRELTKIYQDTNLIVCKSNGGGC